MAISEPITIKGVPPKRNLVPGAKTVLAIASGKGGVGKSSVATNLAIALQKSGATVGLFDADIFGPSLPKMLATQGVGLTMTEDERINPIETFGVKNISIGNVVPEDQAALWRGPMVHQALNQFLDGVNWGELDYFLLDLPPGTGDVHLTMVQSLNVDGAVVVSTPQDVAIGDVRKCIDMFRKVNIPLAGIVENMAYFECDHGERYHLFGKDGAKQLAKKAELAYLGEIPLLPAIMDGGETGQPYALTDQEEIFANIAKKIIKLYT